MLPNAELRRNSTGSYKSSRKFPRRNSRAIHPQPALTRKYTDSFRSATDNDSSAVSESIAASSESFSFNSQSYRSMRGPMKSSAFMLSTQNMSYASSVRRKCPLHPKRIIYTLLNCPMHTKLCCIMLGPLLTIIVLMCFLTVAFQKEISSSGSVMQQTNKFALIADFSHNLAKERGLSLTLQSSETQDEIDRFTALRNSAMETTLASQQELESALDLSHPTHLDCHNSMSSLTDLRQQVSNRSIEKFSAFQKNTQIILQCIEVINAISFTANHYMPQNVFSLRSMMHYKELEGRIRARVASALAQSNLTMATVDEIGMLNSESLVLANQFISTQPLEREIFEGQLLYSKESLIKEEVIADLKANLTSSVKPDEFFQLLTDKLSVLQVIEKNLKDEVLQDAETVLASSITMTVLAYTLSAFTLLLTLILTATCAGCIYYPWKVMLNKSKETVNFTADLVDALSTLDFKQKQIVKLLCKPTYRCTKDSSSYSPLEANLKTIVHNMQLMSSYLPQAMVQQMKNASNTTLVEKSRRKSTLLLNSSMRRASSVFGSVHDSEKQTQKTGGASQLTFSNRDVCICIMDMQNIHQIFRMHSSSDVHLMYTQILESFFPIIQQHRGVAELQGDKIIISWNNAMQVVDKEIHAVTCAWKCHQRLTNELHPQWKKSALPRIEIRVSIVSGEVWTGGVGTDSFQNFVSIAPTVSRAWKYNELFKYDSYFDSVCQPYAIMMDRKCADAVQYHFSCKQVDYTVLKSHPVSTIEASTGETGDPENNESSHQNQAVPYEAIFMVCDALQEKGKEGGNKKESDEWMYEISSVLEREVPPQEKALQKVWKSLSAGNTVKAEEHLHSYRELAGENSIDAEVLKRLESLIDATHSE